MIVASFFKTCFVAVYVGLSLLLTVLIFPFMFLFPKKNRNMVAGKVVKGWARALLFVVGVKVRILGEPISQEPTLYVGNHISLFDVVATMAYLPIPCAYMSKIENKRVPIMWWWMNLIGCVFIDRDNIRQQVKELRTVQDNLANGTSYMIYPEGTRCRVHAILPFKAGSFRPAIKTGSPVQPIGFSGFNKVMKKGSLMVRSAVGTLNVGPVYTEYGDNSQEFADSMRAKVRELVEEVEGAPYPFIEELENKEA